MCMIDVEPVDKCSIVYYLAFCCSGQKLSSEFLLLRRLYGCADTVYIQKGVNVTLQKMRAGKIGDIRAHRKQVA